MKNIAFWSSTPQQGKTTVARFLANNYDYVKISFADPMRFMLERLLIAAGCSKPEAAYFANEGKEQNIEALGTSFRKLARTLGTEWGRTCIHEDLWVRIAESKINRLHSPVCVDDMRFPNELAMLKQKGFLLVKIERDSLRMDGHSSDTALRDFVGWDRVIKNNGSLEQLFSQVVDLVK